MTFSRSTAQPWQTAKDRGDLLAMQAEVEVAILEIERVFTPDQLAQVKDAIRRFEGSRKRDGTEAGR
jgi:hypothetical protein